MPKVKKTTSPTTANVADVAASKPASKKKKAKTAPTDAIGGQTISGGLAPTAPASGSAPGSVIKALAAKSDYKVVKMINTPTSTTGSMASWKLGDYNGFMLKPGEELLLEIPEHLRGLSTRTMILMHRQDKPFEGEHDDNPGLTALHVHATNFPEGKEWRHWNAPWGSSGQQGAKFAEYRSAGDPESETEFDWHIQGHTAVEGHGTDKGKLLGDAIRVRSVGDDPIFVHRIDYKVLPPKPSEFDEIVFSTGTKLGDPMTGSGRHLSEGQKTQGTFPNALQLGSGGAGAAKLAGTNWKHTYGGLEIPLQAGKKMTQIDLAIGDSMPDKKKNKDGGWGTPGYSKLTIRLQRADGKSETLMSSQGLPPEGVISASPEDFDRVAKEGDKLVLSRSGSEAYIMAARVGYRD